jgi:hypothetical protein
VRLKEKVGRRQKEKKVRANKCRRTNIAHCLLRKERESLQVRKKEKGLVG